MGHRLAPEAEAELDGIWYYIAKESGSIEVADRLIESLTDRFFLLARHPYLGRRRDNDLRPGLRRDERAALHGDTMNNRFGGRGKKEEES